MNAKLVSNFSAARFTFVDADKVSYIPNQYSLLLIRFRFTGFPTE
jgi:hypothetical protein